MKVVKLGWWWMDRDVLANWAALITAVIAIVAVSVWASMYHTATQSWLTSRSCPDSGPSVVSRCIAPDAGTCIHVRFHPGECVVIEAVEPPDAGRKKP